ncbi:MAG: FAD-binding oxidoreductase [Proteobacteria bacterium]|nr:FAD-binding oxidoreductase [Pseudomonadota bacterium]
MINLELQLLDSAPLNNNTVNMRFKIIADEGLRMLAGQFLRLHFKVAEGEAFRSYSIASIFDQREVVFEELDIAVSWVSGGLATHFLSAMQVGDKIPASGPFGRFYLPEQHYKRYFLIATGTGVTPYRAMLNEIKGRLAAGAEFYLVMGAQDETGLLYEADFQQIAQSHPNFHYIACLSRKPREPKVINDQKGYTQHYLSNLEFDQSRDICYLCGNPDMIDEAFALLKEKGLPVPQIKREKYISPAIRKPKTSK